MATRPKKAAPAKPKRLPQSLWANAGIIMVKNQHGLWQPSHFAHGDQRAEDIIAGRYSYEQAVSEFERTQQMYFQRGYFGLPTAATFLMAEQASRTLRVPNPIDQQAPRKKGR